MAEGLLLPHAVSAARVPLSTYRLQFNRGFTFRDARAIANSNPWWFDVLENGPSSRFARFFDVDWYPVKDELAEKLLIPILGDQYGAVLEAQELQLDYHHGAFCVRYHDRTLPIAPDTYAAVFVGTIGRWLDDHGGPDADELQSVLTASRNLPERSDREPGPIAVRAREKENRQTATRGARIRDPGGRDLRALPGRAARPVGPTRPTRPS